MDHCLLPNNYLTTFELCRIEFNSQGSTGEIKKETSNMLIFMFFMFRVLIFELLLKSDPWLRKNTSTSSKK